MRVLKKAKPLRLRIKPGFTLLDVPPKVKGTLSVTAGDKRGQLVVHANLAIAYAFNTDNPDQLRDAMDIVSVTRYDQKYVYLDDSFVKVAQGLWAGDTQSLWVVGSLVVRPYRSRSWKKSGTTRSSPAASSSSCTNRPTA
ncbi:hypothetical protein ACFQ1S_46435, partial [Kibdelosporangium lantanae]